MATKKHQFILGLVIKKIREEGATIVGVDGDYPGLFGKKILLPPQIIRHRPDAIGIKKGGEICIGEAKTEGDVNSKRTYEQLADFSGVKLNGKLCEVVVGVPMSSRENFDKGLKKIGLNGLSNLKVLYVPDDIIND